MKDILLKNFQGIEFDEEFLFEVLSLDLNGYTCLKSMPNGGEKNGILYIASIPLNKIPDLITALAYLIKIVICTDEEWSYDNWQPDEVKLGLLPQALAYLSSKKYTRSNYEVGSFLKSVSYNIEQNINAHLLDSSVNKPTYIPNKKIILDRKILQLNFIDLAYLKLIVNDEWNDQAGVFNDGNYWHYVNWSTTA